MNRKNHYEKRLQMHAYIKIRHRHKANSDNRMYGLLATILLLLGCAFAPLSHAEELRKFTDKRATPPLQLNDMHGKPHSLADYRGRVVMVNFWAGWCHPCIQEIPEMINLARILVDKPFTILAVNVAEERKLARYGFVKKMDEHMVILIDGDSTVFEQWQGIGLPSTFIIDPQGTIRYEAYGAVNWDRQDVVDSLMAMMPASGDIDPGKRQ